MFGANVVKQSALLQRHLKKQLLTLAKSSSSTTNIFQTNPENKNNIKQKTSLCSFHKEIINSFNQNMATKASSDEVDFTNRLAFEKSPYLQQHAKNPVDWYPWSDEAFEKSKKENKLIFLSVGYSTCHWCHVMERESFESVEVAKILNEHYVSIKVDREERPDVDKIYMAFVQRTTGSGGWPMSVFLTPDLEPLFGGTYYPPEDQFGRVGFKKLLQMIADQWKKEHNTLNREAKDSLVQLRKALTTKFVRSGRVPNQDSWMKCFQQLTRTYESDYGGFSNSPKFPQPSNFNFLFHLYSKNKSSYEGATALEMCLYTLTKMAYGGIHDHVNCGFARYSVDEKWHIPHFEKMLYDQAQLAVAYVDAFVITKENFYAEVVDDILTYVSRDLSHQEGGFYGAEDADSYPTHDSTSKKEGAFCVWEYSELQALLTNTSDNLSDFDVYCYHFSVKDGGNVDRKYDHHHELDDKNILSCFGSIEKTAEHFNTTVENVKAIIKRCNEILYEVRQERPKPHVDTKIVTAWNGLMISGYARAGFSLNVDSYTERAVKAANFIRKYLVDGDGLLRCCYGDGDIIVQTQNPISGFLDDYAFLIRGLLDLYEATMDSSWLRWAESLQDKQDTVFWDDAGHGYFNSAANDNSIIIRDKEDQDGAEPCGNSISVQNLLRLSSYLGRKDFKLKAEKTLSAYSERLRAIPVALPEMTSALLFYHSVPTQVFIAGDNEDKNTKALIDVVRQKYMPGRILAVADGPKGRAELLYTRHESLAKLKPIHGKPAAYVCRNFACSLPVTDPHVLSNNLDEDVKKHAASSSSSSSEAENK